MGTTFLTYVLSLPTTTSKKKDDNDIILPKVDDVIHRIEEESASKNDETTKIFWKELSCNVLKNLQKTQILSKESKNKQQQQINNVCKLELFNLSFPLYVHIYCELLEL